MRSDIVMQLSPEDCIEGVVEDTLNRGTELWVFGKDVKGKDVKGKDVYIKITMGGVNLSAICISFHIAEHKLRYLFK